MAMPATAPTMLVIVPRLIWLLPVGAVGESKKPLVDDTVVDPVVRVLHDDDQSHHLTRMRISITDTNKIERDEEDEEVVVVLEVLFADCVYRGQRYETKRAMSVPTGTHSLFVHWKPLLVLQHLRPQHS
jgi:hypothetical protein